MTKKMTTFCKFVRNMLHSYASELKNNRTHILYSNEFEDNFKDTEKTNELVSNQLRSEAGDEEAYRSLKKGANTHALSEDAMNLAALQRQREEERAVQMDMAAVSGQEAQYVGKHTANKDRKVIRRKITKTNPDGTQTVTFKFIILPNEVKKAIESKYSGGDNNDSSKPKRKKKNKPHMMPHETSKTPVGHAMFEEEDEGGSIHLQVKRRTRGGRGRRADEDDYSPSRSRKTPGSKSRSKSTDKKSKRKRSEDEDNELYVTTARRKGTSNRKERGAARERMPHVMFSDRLEAIRLGCEQRSTSGPFHRPVAKSCNVYHEKIKRPIDLQAIKDKIQK